MENLQERKSRSCSQAGFNEDGDERRKERQEERWLKEWKLKEREMGLAFKEKKLENWVEAARVQGW